ncbi:MAG: hypothetical protein LBR70_02110 [Lactobacillaceae bacterium]|nr:hypothetical protein [Lactobacillaceae bacterium]
MAEDQVQDLIGRDKLLVRAMGTPEWAADKSAYDFSVWAMEVDSAKNEGLYSLSTTLLVSGEKIPTYKNMGFLINSDLAEVHHIAEMDSGSSGNTKDGNFVANKSDIHTLSELAEKTRNEHLRSMNEVNININSEEAYVGLFVNKAMSDRPKAQIMLAQEYYKQQTGKTLPIYIYDSADGSLVSFNPNEKEKTDFINKMREEKMIRSSAICYKVDEGNRYEERHFDYLDRTGKENPKSASERIKNLRERIADNKEIPKAFKAPYKSQNLSGIDFNTLKMYQEKKQNN